MKKLVGQILFHPFLQFCYLMGFELDMKKIFETWKIFLVLMEALVVCLQGPREEVAMQSLSF